MSTAAPSGGSRRNALSGLGSDRTLLSERSRPRLLGSSLRLSAALMSRGCGSHWAWKCEAEASRFWLTFIEKG
jgi:hypothetical protein